MITRNNYEEFFLLYVDDELSAAERHAVKEFVEANPDLKEEWEAMLQCRLKPDEGEVFGSREMLMQPTEEMLLLYVDGELDVAEKGMVEGSLTEGGFSSVRLQDLEWLRRTVSVPDVSVVFPDKELLYRRGRRGFIPWMGVAAAAVTIGAVLLLIFRSGDDGGIAGHEKNTLAAVTPHKGDTLYSSKTSGSGVSGSKDAGQTGEAQRGEARTGAGQENAGQTNVGQANAGHLTAGKMTAGKMEAGKTGVGKTDVGQMGAGRMIAGQTDAGRTDAGRIDAGKTNVVKAGAGQSMNQGGDQGTDQHSGLVQTDLKPETTGSVGSAAPDRIATTTGNTTVTNHITGDHSGKTPSFATQALLAEAGATPDDEEDPVSPKKSKLRGFFRKVSRVIEKRTTRDDDENHKVYLGGFAIK